MSVFLDALAQRVLVFDGAFGTWVQEQDLGPDDFGGPALEGCNERLVLTRPDLIKQHAQEVFQQAVLLRNMPLNNATGITDQEREVIRQWYDAGAAID